MRGTSTLVKPPRLVPGDRVAVVAPAGPVERETLEAGLRVLSGRYEATWGDGLFRRARYLAGDDARRAAELNGWIRDPDVRAILFARGGYGTSRILDRLDLGALARRPKAIAGFSDLTGLLAAVAQRAGVAAVHGPMVASAGKSREGARDLTRLLSLLAGAPAARSHRGLRALRGGRARAPLAGGNLSLLAHLAGTPFQVEARGRILFVEEVNEPLYRIDRDVRQLLLAGAFRGVAGVALGQFTGLTPAEARAAARLFLEAVGERAVPVVSGLAAGHGAPNRPLPLGVPATLDADAGTLVFDPCVRVR